MRSLSRAIFSLRITPRTTILIGVAIVLACACACSAQAAPDSRAVKLMAKFTPEQLGHGTTIDVGFQLTTDAKKAPSPVTIIELLYPHELGLGSSDLGLETCTSAVLEKNGPPGCPTDSVMGHGSAVVSVPFRTNSVLEQVQVTLISGPVENGHIGLLFYASGELPVLAGLVFPGLVAPAQLPFGGLLETKLPPVPSVPEGPDVALTAMRTTIGPSGLTYEERVGGKTIFFHPRGILLPNSCPRGGFPFAIHLSFQDGGHASGKTAVPCPRA